MIRVLAGARRVSGQIGPGGVAAPGNPTWGCTTRPGAARRAAYGPLRPDVCAADLDCADAYGIPPLADLRGAARAAAAAAAGPGQCEPARPAETGAGGGGARLRRQGGLARAAGARHPASGPGGTFRQRLAGLRLPQSRRDAADPPGAERVIPRRRGGLRRGDRRAACTCPTGPCATTWPPSPARPGPATASTPSGSRRGRAGSDGARRAAVPAPRGRPAADQVTVERERPSSSSCVPYAVRGPSMTSTRSARAGRADAVGDDHQGAARPARRRPAPRAPRPPGPGDRSPRRGARAGRTTGTPGSARSAGARPPTAPPGRPRRAGPPSASISRGQPHRRRRRRSSSSSGTGSGRR